MQYFIADTNFCHEGVIAFNHRPFANVTQMNQALIANWNQVVKNPKDEVYILGDFLYRGTAQQANQILEQLHGKKYLVRGNHESYLKDPAFDTSQYSWIKDYATLKYHKIKFILFHYPILEWDKYFQNAIHLYGHVHDTRQAYFETTLGPRAVNVGADLINYRPISIDQVLALVEQREQTAFSAANLQMDLAEIYQHGFQHTFKSLPVNVANQWEVIWCDQGQHQVEHLGYYPSLTQAQQHVRHWWQQRNFEPERIHERLDHGSLWWDYGSQSRFYCFIAPAN
ncbi:metallophosphoesterase [Lapidilactobacillus wuchangensis]|uniref:metallophosphoesterase n=1 Tax=Lapidilactobacillus wuchangensis TaxID=2486001 RepID=UPI000F794A07|nr:metallophosphoesterase [Lapidilactobacillus wuchangensis]